MSRVRVRVSIVSVANYARAHVLVAENTGREEDEDEEGGESSDLEEELDWTRESLDARTVPQLRVLLGPCVLSAFVLPCAHALPHLPYPSIRPPQSNTS